MGRKPREKSRLKLAEQEERPVQPITRIAVGGYKCIADVHEVAIRPLTLLAGSNSSGKSSLLQPLLLMKQTLEASYDPGALLLDGQNVRFSSADQLITKTGLAGERQSFSVGITLDEKMSLVTEFLRKPTTATFEIARARFTDPRGSEPFELEPHGVDRKVENLWRTLVEAFPQERKKFDKFETRWEVSRHRCFLQSRFILSRPGAAERSAANFRVITGPIPVDLFQTVLLRMIHLPGLRGTPRRTYPRTVSGGFYPGTFPDYAASVIAGWQEDGDERLARLEIDLERMGLGWKVVARRVEDIEISLHISRLKRGPKTHPADLVNIADMGIGVSQSLPILVALLAAEPDDMVYIEQPEIHLHPRAQVAVAEILADAAKRGVRVVAETHSGVLLLAVQALVAEGKLDPGLVKLHWFTRNEEGFTSVQSAELDECGAFGDWPEDFGSVELQLQSRYLDAMETCQRKVKNGPKDLPATGD